MKIRKFTKTIIKIAIVTTMAILMFTTGLSWAQNPPKMKMTTEIPPGITTPDNIKTRIGTLDFFDGVPIGDTPKKVYNFLDFQHGRVWENSLRRSQS